MRLPDAVRRDDGVATVLAAVMVTAILAVAIMVIDVGAAVAARHRAQSAADLAALAGAASAIDPDAACATATDYARANAAEITGCAVHAEFEVTVRVRVAVSFAVFGSRHAIAEARAGPQ